MTQLQVCVGYARIERQRPSVCGLRLRQLLGVTQLTGLLQCVTVLHPDRQISRITVESLAIELSRKSPIPLSQRLAQRSKLGLQSYHCRRALPLCPLRLCERNPRRHDFALHGQRRSRLFVRLLLSAPHSGFAC